LILNNLQAELDKCNARLKDLEEHGAQMLPMATPRAKTQHRSLGHAAKKSTPVQPGSSGKKRKRIGHGGNDSSSQQVVKRNKKYDFIP
jgi:hypothetical protein